MTEEEIIDRIKYRNLNEKCNHYIFSGLRDSELENIISHIPSKSLISNYEDINFALSYTNRIKFISNIFFNMENLEVESLLNIVLDSFKTKERISFLDRKSLMRLRGVLREQQQCIQLIVTQKQILDIESQKNSMNYLHSILIL